MSLVAYMNLLDLGLRGAVTRFVSKGATQEDHEESGRVVSGALWIRLWISLAVVAAGVIFSVALNPSSRSRSNYSSPPASPSWSRPLPFP